MSEFRQLILTKGSAGFGSTSVYYAPMNQTVKEGDVAVVQYKNRQTDECLYCAYEILSVVTVEVNSPYEKLVLKSQGVEELPEVYAIAKRINYEDLSV